MRLPTPLPLGIRNRGDMLQKRIVRVLSIARAYGYTELILGAWGCGAFGNDPRRTASDFRRALEGEFAGACSEKLSSRLPIGLPSDVSLGRSVMFFQGNGLDE